MPHHLDDLDLGVELGDPGRGGGHDLGRRDALIQLTDPDDSPRERVLTGRLAVLYKESIVRGVAYALRHPGLADLSVNALG